ncbi:PqqD family protein [Akkermansia sp.]|uniref:PqqD family protein n=1 Tax=Akkermansia sp. TaxID=1872421 RepID=UPI003AB3CAA6
MLKQYVRNKNIKSRVSFTGYYLYNSNTELVYELNETCFAIWEECVGIFSEQTITERLKDIYVNINQIEIDVKICISTFLKEKIIFEKI